MQDPEGIGRHTPKVLSLTQTSMQFGASADLLFRVGGAYVPAFFAGMYAPLRWVHAKEQHVC